MYVRFQVSLNHPTEVGEDIMKKILWPTNVCPFLCTEQRQKEKLLFFPPIVTQNAAMTKQTANLLTGADTTLERGTKEWLYLPKVSKLPHLVWESSQVMHPKDHTKFNFLPKSQAEAEVLFFFSDKRTHWSELTINTTPNSSLLFPPSRLNKQD